MPSAVLCRGWPRSCSSGGDRPQRLGIIRASAEVCRALRLGVGGGGPAAEELQRVCGAAAGLGGVGDECEAGVGGEVESVVGQVEVADDGVVEVLDAGVVEADVVRG